VFNEKTKEGERLFFLSFFSLMKRSKNHTRSVDYEKTVHNLLKMRPFNPSTSSGRTGCIEEWGNVCLRVLTRRKFCNVGKKKCVLRQAQYERVGLSGVGTEDRVPAVVHPQPESPEVVCFSRENPLPGYLYK